MLTHAPVQLALVRTVPRRSADWVFLSWCLLTTSVVHAEPAPKTFAVSLYNTPVERWFDGTIEAVNQSTVSAQTAGRVEQVMYDVNDVVPPGAVIVRLRGTEQRAGLSQAEAALNEARAAEAEVQLRYKRAQELFAQSASSQQNIDQVSAERDVITARVAAAKSRLDAAREGVSYTEIRAPYAGIVTKRHIQVGESVGPGTLLMTGISLQYLRVSVDLPQSVVPQVRGLQKASLDLNGQRVDAKHITIFPEANEHTHTFKARVDLPENTNDLYPGMFVKVAFVVGQAQKLLVPTSALIERSEITAVYVVDTAGNSSLRQVRLGHRFPGRVEVLAGLRVGETIAVESSSVVVPGKVAASAAHE